MQELHKQDDPYWMALVVPLHPEALLIFVKKKIIQRNDYTNAMSGSRVSHVKVTWPDPAECTSEKDYTNMKKV